ncbi:hypothetical protein M409DRAFT_18060 [Zasmidium cellare ATCC 36951]|uniref:Uncharacterized protein n=1 Tax=Zasmidium cellare ATCC 36951 TaxID=1080233 RepID=A0A6A6CX74_ZASCE|nr:uncharacterized protein M409DRAFT_18060 [Zasmidium cellare ATCC 36951]KAF2171827.1 hypothetical protein M409DRAFT_18060 [Zasmidium cellare ATCC 36951]
MRTRAQAADPSTIDVAYLASTYDVSDTDLRALLEAPTVELAADLLQSLTTKGQEFDALKAEKLRIEVELENTVRTSDTKVKAQKAAVTRHQKEVEQLRTKLNESEAARESLASELEQLRSSSSVSSADTQELRQRIETLQASNRDALALVESKQSEKDRVANELSEQHSKLLALRREVGQLEERNQALENAASSQKFKEQSLQQEIDLLKRNNEWHSNELQTRSKEHAKFRKERNARISNLERELEESNANVQTLKRTETTLRQRLEELQAKADEAFARVAGLQEEAARKEQDFRTELASSKRLAELQGQNAATHKMRLQEVQTELDDIRDESHAEIGRLQTDVETERLDKEDAEKKLAELELKVQSLEERSRPATPRENGGGPQTPGRAGSPSAMPGSMRKVVGGLSFTQLYSQYNQAVEDLEGERNRNAKLSTAIDGLITDLESKKPHLEELYDQTNRLEEQVLNYSQLLEEAHRARDEAAQKADEYYGQAQSASGESELLRQQLRDLSTQIRMLLVEQRSREEGIGEMSADERLELERAARGELEDGALDGMTETGRLISERLVIFRGVSELQEKNADLLRSCRVAWDQIENEEARAKSKKAATDAQEVEDLRHQLERYKDELQATATQIDSYMKERDMFRRMLNHRGQLPADADLQSMFEQSVAPATPMRNSVGPPATPRSKDVEDLNKLLKEQQTFFDQYRNESSEDRRMLREQVDALAREKSTLQGDLARVQSQLTLATERFEMLQSNYSALRNENGELQKRSQHMAEQAAKQDLRTQQVAEELVEARSMAESLRNENANTKAEKDLWKRIEARLTEDNKNLMEERSRLNKLVTDLQNLQNERELSESENRRRLQGRAEQLESELADAKKKLEAEVDESRKASLRREYEEGQSRTRIDDLVKSLSTVREELVAAKTARDGLQSRVDEMRIELRSAEEKVVALQPRPTPRTVPTQISEQQSNGDNQELPAEQRLALEISELRRDLELSKTELENSKQQIEQYRSIAQATEEELANFNQTADQYKEDTDRVIAEKDEKIKQLEQRIEDLTFELTTSNSELSELRTKADDNNRVLAEQKASFESELTRLRDDVDRHAEEKKLFQEDIKAQAEIAQQAQQSYEAELVKHAEAAKSLQTVRKEYNDLRTEVAGLKAEADAAKASLERGEESWSEQRDRFERELEEAKRKRQDVDEQNRILHQNLETFSSELAALRQGRAEGEAREGSPSVSGDGNFQEVIRFLRREKEIVDVQYELSIQEAKRLQQQLDYANSQLEETRQKLADERRKSSDQAATEGSTNKLMQTINELNLFRESATTLRNEARQAREKLEEKTKEIDRLASELEPLKGRIGELEGELESKQREMKLLQDDRDHWRERTQNIISKYDRVDPTELEDMKKQLEELKAEKERLESEQAPLREQIDGFDDRLEQQKNELNQTMKDRLDRFREQAKEQDRKRTAQIKDGNEKIEALNAELEKAKADLDTANAELQQTKTALEEERARKSNADDAEEGQVQEDGTAVGGEEHAALNARIAEAEQQAGEHSSRAQVLDAEVQTLRARVQELEGQVAGLQQQLQAAQAQANPAGEQMVTSVENTETLEKLKQDLATAQQEVETLRATTSTASAPPAPNAEPAPGERSVAEQVKDEVAKLQAEIEQQHELAKKQLEEEHAAKEKKLKSNLARQLSDERVKIRAEAEKELLEQHAAEIQRIKDEHNAALEQLKEAHKAELEKLSKEGGAAADQTKVVDTVKTEAPTGELDVATLELTDAQARELVKSNAAVMSLLQTNLRAQVDKQTEKLRLTIAAKDEEIAKLKEQLQKGPSGEAGETPNNLVTREELEKQLAAAQEAKEKAVRQAHAQAEMKDKLQKNQLVNLQAKIAIVKKAAEETPTKPIKEVHEEVMKWKPAPKAAAPAAGTPSPASAVPSSAQKPGSAVPPGTPATPSAQPSQPVAASPNPEAPVFAPASSAAPNTAAPPPAGPNAGTGPATLRGNSQSGPSGIPQPGAAGASKLPRAPGNRSTSSSGGPGMSIQGAASSRGGATSGIGRGGSFRGRGGLRGGTTANAGQKRTHDGNGENGDVKRTRGGGPGGAS